MEARTATLACPRIEKALLGRHSARSRALEAGQSSLRQPCVLKMVCPLAQSRRQEAVQRGRPSGTAHAAAAGSNLSSGARPSSTQGVVSSRWAATRTPTSLPDTRLDKRPSTDTTRARSNLMRAAGPSIRQTAASGRPACHPQRVVARRRPLRTSHFPDQSEAVSAYLSTAYAPLCMTGRDAPTTGRVTPSPASLSERMAATRPASAARGTGPGQECVPQPGWACHTRMFEPGPPGTPQCLRVGVSRSADSAVGG